MGGAHGALPRAPVRAVSNSLGDLDSPAMMALVPLVDLANHRTPDLGEVEPVSVDYRRRRSRSPRPGTSKRATR